MVDEVPRASQRVWWRPAARIGAILGPVTTCAILASARGIIAGETAALLLVVWVVAAAASGDRLAAVLAAVAGGAGFDFFLTEPYLSLAIEDPDDIQAVVLLFLIGLAVTEVALWGRRQQAHAARRSGYLDGVVRVARAVAEGEATTDTVVDFVAGQIADVLGADSCRFVAGPVHDVRVAMLAHDGDLTRDGRESDVDRRGLPSDEYVAIPVRRGPRVVGHFLVTASTRTAYPDREQCRVAVLLADQVAASDHDQEA